MHFRTHQIDSYPQNPKLQISFYLASTLFSFDFLKSGEHE